MGSEISRPFLNFFNEIHVIMGCGVVGLVISLFRREYKCLCKVLVSIVVAGTGIYYAVVPAERKTVSKNQVVLITGCDSGLGFAMAAHLIHTPVTIITTFLSIKSQGALSLKSLCKREDALERCHFLEMDITNAERIEGVIKSVCKILISNPEQELIAMVNNSGVMAFGEFEWQTDAIIQYQLDVNVVGTMRLTHQMMPIIRKNKTRIVTVTSHCALETLPGLSVYGASKKALAGWIDAIRVEMKPYGIDVVNFIPGSFVMSSNISARQTELAKEMKSAMSAEQRHFYGEYFDRYNRYLSVLSGDKPPGALNDSRLMELFEAAIFDVHPCAVYKHEPLRYKIYYNLFQWCPYWIRDILVQNFVSTPSYDSPKLDHGDAADKVVK